MNQLIRIGLPAVVAGALFAACSGTGMNSTNGTGDAQGTGASASTGSGGAPSWSGTGARMGSNVGGGFTVAVTGTGSGTGGSGGMETCAGETSKAQLIPLDIYLMLDSSGSMNDTTGTNGTGPSKWDAVTQALTSFFADPSSAGLGVGLQHFPLTAAGVPASCAANTDCPGSTGPCLLKACTGANGLVPCSKTSDCTAAVGLGSSCAKIGECGNELCLPAGAGNCSDNGLPCTALTSSYCINQDSCSNADYATPAVEISALNGASSQLGSAIMGWMPGGSTPTAAALGGAIQHAKTWAGANPTHTVVVVLATDGLPTECMPQDIPSIAMIAQQAAAGSPPIKTFAIGVFAPADISMGANTNLDQIAAAGGTNQAFIIDTTQNVEMQFIAALNAIRGTKLACEYQVPPPGDAGTSDYSKVNVEYTPPNASMPTTIGYVGKAADCDPMKGGWYYDIDPATGGTPSKIIMCPATCTTFGSAMGGQVDISVGCKTIIQPPPG